MAKQGRTVHADLVEPDDVYPDLWPVWIAFHELSKSRPIGFAASGGIPWSEASKYCEDNGVTGPGKLRWIRLIQAMDVVYLEHQGETLKDRAEREKEAREVARGNVRS